MTGRELILYILQNNLENAQVLKDCVFIGTLSETDVAAKFGVGTATVRAWYDSKMITGTKIGDSLYFNTNVADPRIKMVDNID